MDIASVASLSNILPFSVIISITGVMIYFFGKMVTSSQPLIFNDKFKVYFQGTIFVLVFVVIPIIVDITLMWLIKIITTVDLSLIFGLISMAAIVLSFTKIFPKEVLEGKRPLKFGKDFPARKFMILSALIFFPAISYFEQGSILFMLYSVIFFIMLILTSFISSIHYSDFPPVEFTYKNDSKLRGQLKEITDDFVKIEQKNKIVIIPIEEMKSLKVEKKK